MEVFILKIIAAFLLAFALCAAVLPLFIRYASKRYLQPIYEDAPAQHQQKAKTPTMGGAVFVAAAIVSAAVFAPWDAHFACGVGALALFCGVGMVDDLAKIRGQANHAGLSARAKMALLVAAALAVAAALLYCAQSPSALVAPVLKTALLDLGVFAAVFTALVMVSSANAINLTDGLDGLAAVCSIFALGSLLVLALLGSNALLAAKFNLFYTPHIEGLLVLAAALIGALVGFLWFNAHPAQIFMGDSGSLAIGGFVGLLAAASKNELLLVLIGGIFVAETVSVILQVASFRLFGRRIFKMSPLHHHFEQLGWAESKVSFRFFIVAFLLGALALALQLIL